MGDAVWLMAEIVDKFLKNLKKNLSVEEDKNKHFIRMIIFVCRSLTIYLKSMTGLICLQDYFLAPA